MVDLARAVLARGRMWGRARSWSIKVCIECFNVFIGRVNVCVDNVNVSNLTWLERREVGHRCRVGEGEVLGLHWSHLRQLWAPPHHCTHCHWLGFKIVNCPFLFHTTGYHSQERSQAHATGVWFSGFSCSIFWRSSFHPQLRLQIDRSKGGLVTVVPVSHIRSYVNLCSWISLLRCNAMLRRYYSKDHSFGLFWKCTRCHLFSRGDPWMTQCPIVKVLPPALAAGGEIKGQTFSLMFNFSEDFTNGQWPSLQSISSPTSRVNIVVKTPFTLQLNLNLYSFTSPSNLEFGGSHFLIITSASWSSASSSSSSSTPSPPLSSSLSSSRGAALALSALPVVHFHLRQRICIQIAFTSDMFNISASEKWTRQKVSDILGN